MRSEYNSLNVKKRFISDKKDLMREMCSCKDCECETYPYCINALGKLCKECFDIQYYTHKTPVKNDPGRFHLYDNKNQRIDTPITPITHPYIKILSTALDGDCLYSAISLAFDKKITVEMLRFLVASNQNQDTYQAYKELSSYMQEYEPIKGTHSIGEFKILMKKTGEQIGCTACIWGDENALQIIATEYNLTFVIFNEKGQHIQKINSLNNQTSRYVLLLLNSSKQGNEHYNLLQFNNHRLITPYEWDMLKQTISERKRNSKIIQR